MENEAAEEVKALGGKHYEAASAADVTTLRDLLSDDLAYLHATGRRDTKASYLELVASGRYRDVETVFSPEQVWVFGDVAVMASKVTSSGVMEDRAQAREGLALDAWRRRDGRWQLFAHHMQEDCKKLVAGGGRVHAPQLEQS